MENHLGMQCDTCGVVNWEEALATCCKCGTSRHVYCMLVNVIEVPEMWTCEDCVPNKDRYDREENFQNPCNDAAMQGGSTKNDKLELQIKSKNAKHNKVKFIPLEEVLKLSSGSAKSGSPSKSNVGYKSGTSSVAPNNSPSGVKPNPNMMPVKKPPGYRKIHISSMSSQLASRASKEQKAIIHDVKESSCKEQKNAVIKSASKVNTCKEDVLAKEVKNRYANFVAQENKTSNMKAEEAVNKSLCTSPTSVENLPITEEKATTHSVKESSCKEQKNAVSKFANDEVDTCKENMLAKVVNNQYANLVGQEEKACEAVNKSLCTSLTSVDHPTIIGSDFGHIEVEGPAVNLALLDIYHPYFPAKDSIWKGGFKFRDTITPGEFYGGFQAQPSSTLSVRAHKFSETMPIILQVVLLPQNDVWADLFQNDYPNFSDIALYFFPSANVERSNENHANLFKLLETRNSVMKSCIYDVELLIFTSKQLHPLLQDIAEGLSTGQFLWGMFCEAKGEKIPLEPDHASTECSALSDMEIDMEGGQPRGRVDTVVKKESSKSICGKSIKETIDEEVTQKVNSDSSSVHFSQKLLKLADATREVDIPPGFEKLYQQNFGPGLNIRPSGEIYNPACWNRPPTGWIKLNVAVSLKGGNAGVAGASGIIRDESGKWIVGYSLNLGQQTILTAEFWALFQGLTLAWNEGFRKILVETESFLAMEHLRRTLTSVDANKAVVDCCMNLIKRDWNCKLAHINRDANLSASCLATGSHDHPLGMTVFKSPPGSHLQKLLQNDSTTLE